MSKNISVKINSGNETVETVKLNATNKKVIIKAQPNVNYELVDDNTQYAPETIDTKRIGNDLYIAFEGTDINQESDLVLEGYYENNNTELLLGKAENEQYYAYVPQSGVESDAVTLLAEEVFAPQALGGNSVATPFWAFNPNWLWAAAGVAAVGGIIAAASGGKGSSNPDTTAPAKPTVEAKDNGSVEVTPPADADTKSVEVSYTDEAGTPKTATLTKGEDGNWTSNNPDVAVDPATGKATIPADKVKDGSPVTAKATDNAGNAGEEGTANAGNNPDTTAPAKPTVEAKDNGSVEVTPPADADTKSVEVSYTDEAGTPKTATLTKGEDGNWTSNNPDVAVAPATGKATIPADKVKDGSPVTAKATDTAGNAGEEGTANAGNNPDTTAPSAPEVTPSTTDGSVTVKVPSDAQTGDTVEVTVTPEGSDTPEKVTLTKQADGSWTSDKPETVPNVEAGKDSTTIPQDKVKDGSEVSAQAKDPSGNESTPVKANAGNNAAAPDTTAPSAPEVTPSSTDGSVKVKVPGDAEAGDTVEVTVTPEGSNTPEKVTLTKQADGSWTSDKPETVPSVEAGKDSTTIPQDKVKDGSEVSAQAKDPSGNESTPVKANAGNNAAAPDTTAPAKPTVEAKDNGSVEVTPPADADTKSVEVSYTDEAGTPKTATLTKGEDGNWTSNNPDVAVDPATGKATIPADKVKDGSPVTAKATDNAGNAGEEGTANAGNNPDTTAPSAPEVTPSTTDGSVTVKVPSDAQTGDTVEVTVTPEGSDTPEKVTLTKQADGSWTSDKPETVPSVEAGKDSTTIPQDKVKDGSEVSAQAKDPSGNESTPVKANAGNNAAAPDTTAPAKPTVEAKDNGSVEVTPPADADTKSVEVGYTDEAGTPKTATLTKGEDGNWTSNNPDVAVDPATGKATIPADKVKDGSPVTAKATDNAGNAGEEGTANAGNNPDTTAPSAPEVTPSSTDGSVKVKVPGDAEAGDTVEVTVTPEGSNTPEKVTLTKQADGSWTSDKPETVPSVEAGKDSTTIPQDKVKDGSEVSAQAKDPSGNESTPVKANAGNNAAAPDTTAPAKPTVEAKDNGSVEVTPPADADTKSVEVSYTDEAGTPKTATVTKGEDGTWTSSNPDVAVDPATGKATIPADKVKDGSPVTAKATDTVGNAGEEGTANAGNNPDTTAPSAPEVTPSTTDGSVTVKVPSDAQTGDTVEVTVTPEGSDTPEKVTLTKQADGSWTSDKPETVPSVEAGKDSTTIPQDKVKDGSEVSAQAKDPSGNESTPVKANAGNNAAAPDTTAPAKPTVEAKDNGSVEVTPPADADTKSVEVSYTDEAGTPKTATLTKGEDGNWTSNNPDVAVAPATGKATIPADKVKDGSPVTAKATDTAGNAGEEGTANAGNNPDTTAPSAPEVTPSSTDGSVKVKVPGDAEAGDTVEVTVTPEGSNTPEKVTLTKQADGSWTSDKPETVPSVEAGKDSTTIPQDKVKDGSEVSAQAKDPSGNESTPVKANAGNNAAAPDTTAPAKPTVEAKDNGSVEVTPPADADTKSVEVSYTDEAGTPKTATLTKGEDGNWTSNNPDVAVAPATGKATIPADKVKDGSPVTAKATDTAGNAGEEGTANAGNNPDTTAPSAPEVTPSTTDGSVTVKVPSDAQTGDTVEVTVTPEGSDTPEKVTLTKQADGSWTSDKPETVPSVEAGKDSTTIPQDKVKDGSEVSAQAKDPSGNESTPVKANAGNNAAAPDTTAPAKPTVEAKDNGSVEVTPPADADTKSVEVSYTDEAGTPKTATVTKGEDGTWTSSNPDVAVDPATGKATIPADKVKDGSPVTAKATDNAGNAGEEGTANAGNNPDTTAPSAPEVTPSSTDGSVKVKVPGDAEAGDTVEVTVTPEGSNTPEKVTLTKQADGSWTSDKPETVPSVEAGKDSTTIPQDKVKDGSEVSAQAKDPSGNESTPVKANAGNNAAAPDTTAPAKPTVEAKDNGSVEVTPPADADTKSVEVSYTDEAGTPKTATLTKGEDGNWTSNNPDVAVAPATGKATIPADKVKDGSPVTAKATDNAGNAGEEGTANAGNNPDTTAPSAPEVTPSTTDGSVTVKVPSDAQTGDTVEVTVTPEGSDTPEKVTLTKQADGSWTSDKPETVPSVEAGKDSTTIPQDKVKDGSEVSAQAKDPSGNESTPVKANAGNNAAAPDTTAPAKPTVEAKDNGSVEVTPPADADTKSVEVGYTDEAGTPKTATLTKGEDGNWTSNNPDVAVDPATGKATIPADKVKDGSPVTAKATDNAGNAGEEGTANAGNNPDTTAPSAPEVTPSSTDGSVKVKVPGDAEAGDTVEVTVTPEGSNTPEKVTLTKQADGSWTSDKPETVPSVEAGKDSTTIPQDKVKDGSEVSAQAKDPSGNESTPVKANAGNNAAAPDTTAPAKPTVEAKDNGSVEVTPPADADTKSVEVSYTDEAGTPKTATVTKGEDGTWTSSNPDVAVDPATGKATIPADKVKDGSPVTAKATDTVGNAGEEGTANAGNNPDTTAPSAPEVTPSTTDGSVTVKVPSDAQTGDTVEVTVTPEGSDTPEKVTLTKQADGSWTSDKPETVPSVEAGKDSTTIPQDKVKDGSEVSAQAKDPSGNESTPVKANAGNNAAAPDTTAPAKPTVEAKDNGSVEVTPPADADTKSVEVSYTDEAGTPKTATLTKGEDGNWTSNNPDVAVAPATGKATIPADKVKDGSPVTAKATDTAGNAGEEGTANAGNNPDTTAPSAPEVTPSSTDGSVKVKVPGDAEAGDTVEVTVTPEGSNTPEKVTLTKQADGSWTSDKPETVPSVEAGKDSTTIPQDKVKDGSEVSAQAKDPSGNESTPVKANAGNNAAAPDTTAPAKPTVEAKDNGSVEVTPPADADTKSVEVSYTDEAGTPKTATLTKGEDGNWTSNNPDVAVDPATGKATIPADKVKDGSPVTAKATDNAGNAGEEGTANAGNNPDTTAPAKPTVEAKDNGSVEVTPPADADTKSVEVSYTDEAGTPKTATLTKGEDGNWTSNNPDVAVAPATGKATIPADKVKDGSPVTAKATDTAGNAGEEGTANAGNNPDTTAPSAPEVTPSTTDGSVTVKVPSDAQTGDTVEVTVTPEGSDTPEKVTLTKQADGSWTSDKPETVPNVEAGKDSTTIPQDKVKDGSEVSAQAKDPSGNESTPVKANAGNNAAAPDTTAPAKPTVEAKDNGSVEVTPPADADTKSVEVSYTDEAGTPKTATLTKGEDGNWTSNNPDVAVDPATGKATIPADKVKDGSPVTAKATDNAGNAGEEGTANAGNNPDTTAPAKPTVEAKDNGSVEVTPPADADTKSVEVSYTDEAGTPKTATLTKGEDGNWTSNNPDVAVDPATGKATIPADKVKDGSPVTAKATDNAGNAGEEGTANAGNNPDTTAPAKPTVEAKDNGSVEVTPPADADTKSVEVSYTDEAGTPKTATLTKGEDGNWTSNNPDVAVAPATGKATIPADKVKDGSPVTAKATDTAGNAGEEGTANAGNNPDTTAPSAPEVTPSTTDGSVTVKVPSDAQTGDTVEVTVTPEGSDTPEKVTLTKQADGSWTSDKPETVPNVEAGKDSTTIPQDKVKDGSEVSAKAKDPAGNESAATTVTAGNDKPSAPTVTASTEDGSVTVAVPDDAKQGDVLNVAVQGNDDPAQKTVTLTKQTDGSWTSNNPDVVPNIEVGKNSTTIPQDKVKDGSDVAAIVVRNNMPSDNATAQAGADKVVTSPTLTSNDDGSVVVNVPADAAANDTVEVTVTPESITGNATPVTVVLTKQADGSWTSSNESVVPNVKAGESNTTIDNNSVEDLSKVSAVTKTPTGLESEKTEVQALLDPPALEAATDSGDVIIELPANADIGDAVAVYFTQPSGTKYVSMVQKQADGTWAGVEEGVFNISNNKATISGSNIQDNTEVSVQHVYKTATDEIGAEYNDDGSAKAITDLTKASKLVSIISGEDKVVKLELSLAQDTGASNNDNYTRNGQVNVSGIPSGSEWEYSTDGGQTWNSGSGNSFTLPNNTKVGGIAYSLQARVKGNAASTSDTLNMTLDQKAGEFHAIIDESMNLIGTAEKNSTLTINNHSGSSDENGEFEFATGIVPNATVKKVPYTVVETDLAGNTISKDVAYTYYRRYGANTNDSYGSENDVILIGTKGGTGDLGALIKSSLNTGDGDDSVYAIGVQYHSNTLDTGNGNDFASFKNIAGTINMGAGNDILEARNTDNPFFYLAGGHPTINMGSGDDIVRTPSMINTRASIDGGDGFDTLEFVNRDGKPITTTISMISHFEKIDITGTLNNSVTISASDVEKNHSATATVDASGKSHNNVLIVDGDAGDKVTLSGISKAANSQVTYEGNTYNVYNTGSNELWVDSDITVA